MKNIIVVLCGLLTALLIQAEPIAPVVQVTAQETNVIRALVTSRIEDGEMPDRRGDHAVLSPQQITENIVHSASQGAVQALNNSDKLVLFYAVLISAGAPPEFCQQYDAACQIAISEDQLGFLERQSKEEERQAENKMMKRLLQMGFTEQQLRF